VRESSDKCRPQSPPARRVQLASVPCNQRVAADFERHELRALHSRSTAKGVAIFLLDLVVFATAIGFCVLTDSLWLKAGLSVVAGISTSLLFVVAHDACHQSLTPHRWLNRLIGTLAFLPCLHPFSLWDLGHNRIHHTFTNRRGKDYVWEPLTHAEFAALSGLQKLKYRFFRTAVGHYWYYLSEIWWKKMFFPRRAEIGNYKRDYVIDHVVLSAWLVVWPGAILEATWLASGKAAQFGELGMSLLICCIIPFLVFNLLMSSVIYLHHMHPQVAWVTAGDEIDQRRLQMMTSVHVVFPYYTNLVFHRIMEHTAHHLRPGIPLYNLENGQTLLETSFPEIIVHKWSPRSHFDILARCKLFDLKRRCWVGYDGAPTAPAITPEFLEGRSSREIGEPRDRDPFDPAPRNPEICLEP
jgi:acyl-lipid omega-6 desaturase (Delta-12 desaturase)